MVNMRILSLLVVCCACANGAAGVRGFEPQTIKVTAAGLWSPNQYGHQTRQECARFTPSDRQVRNWFGRARAISKANWMEQTEWTQCSAEGSIVSKGVTYRWRLDQSGRGAIALRGGDDIYLSGPELPFDKTGRKSR